MHGVVGCWALRAPEKAIAQPDVACNTGQQHPFATPRSTTMPRLTLGAWLFVIGLVACLGGSVWALAGAIT
ncbi:hypothetical protein D3C77_439170 [compost metagenome]